MAIHVPFLGRLKFKHVYDVRKSEHVLMQYRRIALTLLRPKQS